jgi:large subunit ribosomal protein L10
MLQQEPQHNLEDKKQIVNRFTELINEYSVVAAVNIQGLPAKQLSEMRADLRGKAKLKVGKATLMQRAFSESEKNGLQPLTDYFIGMPALLFTEENPFKLFQRLKDTKTSAPIKAGQTAPDDIVIPEGPTDFAPGPIIGELSNFGVGAGIEGGKVVVQNDATVAEAGETVDGELAGILNRLEIHPMEIGLNITAAYEDGDVIPSDVLDINPDRFKDDMEAAASRTYRLGVAASIPNTTTIKALLANAQEDALKLAKSQDIITEETIEDMIATANAHAQELQDKTTD